MSAFTIVFLSTLLIGVLAASCVVIGAYRLWKYWRDA